MLQPGSRAEPMFLQPLEDMVRRTLGHGGTNRDVERSLLDSERNLVRHLKHHRSSIQLLNMMIFLQPSAAQFTLAGLPACAL